MLHGLSVWALAFLLAILIAGASVTGGVTALLGGEAEQVNASETFVGDLITPDTARGDQALIVPQTARVETEAVVLEHALCHLVVTPDERGAHPTTHESDTGPHIGVEQ